MSNKKSLGSSPIGYSALGTSSFQFIPDLGVSRTETSSIQSYNSAEAGAGSDSDEACIHQHESQTSEKKITSYYLEIGLVDRLKVMADDQNTYYSTMVSEAIRYWVDLHGY